MDARGPATGSSLNKPLQRATYSNSNVHGWAGMDARSLARSLPGRFLLLLAT